MKNKIIEIISNTEGLYLGDLIHYFRVAFFAPNCNNPYHNFRHTSHVLVFAYEGGCYENLSKTDLRALLIAALFHDYGHSGVMGNDPAQIKVALEGLHKNILPQDVDSLSKIESFIKATMWPHDESVSMLPGARILRDADMAQSVSDVWIQQNIFGLAQEFGITPLQQLKNQKSFLLNLKLYSMWGESYIFPKVKERLTEVEFFINSLETVS